MLTRDPRADYPDLERRLRERAELVEGMRLRNLHHDLREAHVRPKEAPLALRERVFTPLEPDAAHRSQIRDGAELLRTRYAADGETKLPLDRCQTDGSLLLTDRRDCRERGTVGAARWCSGPRRAAGAVVGKS